MKRIFLVDREMCGGEHLPPEFDLDDFCEVLQGKVADIEILPSDGFSIIENRGHAIVSRRAIEQALGESCPH